MMYEIEANLNKPTPEFMIRQDGFDCTVFASIDELIQYLEPDLDIIEGNHDIPTKDFLNFIAEIGIENCAFGGGLEGSGISHIDTIYIKTDKLNKAAWRFFGTYRPDESDEMLGGWWRFWYD